MTCKCHPDSPFRWRENPRPSIFYKDNAFRAATTTGLSFSQKSTEVVEQARQEGRMLGFIRGISARREEEMARVRMFHMYTRGGYPPKKGKP